MSSREYQAKAVSEIREHWRAGRRSVCLVSPTGSGKTHMAEEALCDAERVLVVAHRRDLVIQTHDRFAEAFGRREVGVILPGEHMQRAARIQVSTIQSYLARAQDIGFAPTHVLLDEAHHYVADEWRRILAIHPNLYTLGLTATPERGDGRPLGDVFGAMVVAANYSALIAAGFLVPVKVWRPESSLGADLAQDPVEAWQRYGERGQAFVFCSRVSTARSVCRRFGAAGARAAVIDAHTPAAKRDRAIADFRRGHVRAVVNVHTMTEGIDVPEASVCILARQFHHVGSMLQATGRVLRPSIGKGHAVVIDLTGSTLRHGLPTDDREYSLDGRPISGGNVAEREPAERAAFHQEVVGEELHLVAGSANASGEDEGERLAPVKRKPQRQSSQQMLAGSIPA